MSQLYQYSHFLAVSRGLYDGDLSIQTLKEQGTVGLGTFNALDGELVVVDGNFYHCTEGKKVRQAENYEQLPWAAMTSFTSNKQMESLRKISSLEQLETQLLTFIQTCNYPYVLQIKGSFNNLTIGSVPKQTKPYLSIEKIIEGSIQVETGPVIATCVGFYAPEFMFPIKSTGLHLHCISDAQQFGGHVLNLDLQSAELHFEAITQFQIELPQNEVYQNTPMNGFKIEEHVPVFSDRLAQIKDSN